MRRWARRAAALHAEIAEVADVARDPRWWLVAGGAALAWQDRDRYLASDAEPEGDTFIGHRIGHDATLDPLLHALARAHAARLALRDLDGQLPEQPLAMTIRRGERGAVLRSSSLEVAAIAIGDRVLSHRLAPRFEDETGELVEGLGVPFVCVTIGEEPIETARHGHRRAWLANGVAEGPWLGLGRTAGMDIVSTCHLVVDGYGHAWLAAQIAEHTRRLLADAPRPTSTATLPSVISTLHAPRASALRVDTPRPAARADTPPVVAGAIPLRVTWRELRSPAPRALRLAYALGRMLHALAGERDAPFSPTFQIPVAPGEQDDSERVRRRVVPAIASVRFSGGVAEPYEAFAIRTREILAREASGDGLSARLLAAAQAVPAPLAWKRRAVGPRRPGWLEPVANVVGGRGCVSRIQVDVVMPPSCAVSSPSRLASDADPLGSCVVTVIDDGVRAAITLCGSGLAGDPALLDELLALLRR